MSERHGAGLDARDRETLGLIAALDQRQLLAAWPEGERALPEKRALLAQVRRLDQRYPGGLQAYLHKARELLLAAREGASPYAGCVPKVPEGESLVFGDEQYQRAAERGLRASRDACFVLVAGGLGERLGYPGIKLGLPAETATRRSFLDLYAQQIRALQAASAQDFGPAPSAHSAPGREPAPSGAGPPAPPSPIPLGIMTSDDTHQRTLELLEQHRYFGLDREQVTLMKQEKVASLSDARPSLTTLEGAPFELDTKPHGHGDVHLLLHQTGLARRWLARGKRYLVLFQDTNALALHGILPALGISEERGFELNSLVVPRRAGEAVGGIVQLDGPEGSLTINVEYNQLEGLLRANGLAGDEADARGFSPFPGNINVLVLALGPYVETLEATRGVVPEFVNPKYADAARTRFSKPTRLECMMQDYPRLLPAGAKVGFTSLEREVCFSAVKNALPDAAQKAAAGLPPESAGSAEAELYAFNRRLLTMAGAELEADEPRRYGGIELRLFPLVVLGPALQLPGALGRVRGLRLSPRSTLVIEADAVEIDGLELEGALVIRARPGVKVVIQGARVHNNGWSAEELGAGAEGAPEIAMRGFHLLKTQTLTLAPSEPGEFRIEGDYGGT